MSTKETNKLELEKMLDGGHSVADILNMLAEICDEKGEHVRTNWQYKALSESWYKASVMLYKASVSRAAKTS